MNGPTVEIQVPGATSDDIRVWANNIAEANPIATGDNDFTPTVNLDVTDYPFMGVELMIQSERRHLLTLVLFADRPTEKEKEIMETNTPEAGGQ